MRTIMQQVKFLLICSLAFAPLLSSAQDGEAPVYSHKGTVDVIELASNRLTVSGMAFEVPLDTPVNIRGAAGAFSLLQQGMKAEVVYREYPESRVAIQIDQLPDNVEIEQF